MIILTPIFHRKIYRSPPFSALLLPEASSPEVHQGPGAEADDLPSQVLSGGHQWSPTATSPTSLISSHHGGILPSHTTTRRLGTVWFQRHTTFTWPLLHYVVVTVLLLVVVVTLLLCLLCGLNYHRFVCTGKSTAYM